MNQIERYVKEYWQLRGINPLPRHVIRPNAKWTSANDIVYQTYLIDERWQDWQWSLIKHPTKKWERLSFSDAELVGPRQYVYVPVTFEQLESRVLYIMEGLPDTQTMIVNGKAAIGLFNNSIVRKHGCIKQLHAVLRRLRPTGIMICPHNDAWHEQFPELTTVRMWYDTLRPACQKVAPVKFLDVRRVDGSNDWNDVWKHAQFNTAQFAHAMALCACETPHMPKLLPPVKKPVPDRHTRRLIKSPSSEEIEQHIRAEDMVDFAKDHAPSPHHGVKQYGNKWKILGNGGFWITNDKKWSIGCYKGCPGGKSMISLWKYLKYGDFNVPTHQVLPEIRAYFNV